MKSLVRLDSMTKAWAIFTPDGVPLAWAIGMTSVEAINRFSGGLDWKGFEQEGYTAHRVEIREV